MLAIKYLRESPILNPSCSMKCYNLNETTSNTSKETRHWLTGLEGVDDNLIDSITRKLSNGLKWKEP